MKTISFCTLLSLLFLLTACNKDDDQPTVITLGQEFEIDYKESGTYDEAGLEFIFSEVLEESRCPTNVICVWEGRAVVALTVNDDAQDPPTIIQLATLNSLDGDSLLTATYGNYQIELIDVKPYPDNLDIQDFDDYSVVLKVEEL